jgi:hypothetical protein
MAKRKRRRRRQRPVRSQPRNWSLMGIGTVVALVALAGIVAIARAT